MHDPRDIPPQDGGYSGSTLEINRSSQGATRRMFVVPCTLNGTPAVTTIWSSSRRSRRRAPRDRRDHRALEAFLLGA